MDKIAKALQKLSEKEREAIKNILIKLKNKGAKNLSIKKLKGRNDIFRVRKGNIRIIYRVENNQIYILAIEKRNENTYNL